MQKNIKELICRAFGLVHNPWGSSGVFLLWKGGQSATNLQVQHLRECAETVSHYWKDLMGLTTFDGSLSMAKEEVCVCLALFDQGLESMKIKCVLCKLCWDSCQPNASANLSRSLRPSTKKYANSHILLH